MTTVPKRVFAALAVATTAAAALVACSSSDASENPGSASQAPAQNGGDQACSNTITKKGVPVVTFWGWHQGLADVVDMFNASHDDVQVCWSNAGQGTDEYTKFSTAVQAGSGAPDVVQIEYDWLPSYIIQNALVDLTTLGAKDLESSYTAGSWRDVSSGSGVYGVPTDSGPVGLFYRADILQKAGIEVPTTWEEFAAAAQKLKDSGSSALLTNFPPNWQAYSVALFDQAGARPFEFDGAKPTDITININDPAAVTVLQYWLDLGKAGLVGTDDAWTADYGSKLAQGNFAMYIGAAWGSSYLSGLSGNDPDAQWRAAPLPQWEGKPAAETNIGGSAFAVTTQSKQAKLAYEVASGLYASKEAMDNGIKVGGLFPTQKDALNQESFGTLPYPFYGDQPIMGDVFVPAANAYKGMTYSPFTKFFYDTISEEFGKAAQGGQDAQAALDAVQQKVADYAKQQGFTVTTN